MRDPRDRRGDLLASSAAASTIVAPSIGGRNTGLAGNDVATPLDGPGMLLSNPAGVVEVGGIPILDSRKVTPQENPAFPGRYEEGGGARRDRVHVPPGLNDRACDRVSPWRPTKAAVTAVASAIA